MKKLIFGLFLVTILIGSAPVARAITLDDLWREVGNLTQQVSELKSQLSAAASRAISASTAPTLSSASKAQTVLTPISSQEQTLPSSTSPLRQTTTITAIQAPTTGGARAGQGSAATASAISLTDKILFLGGASHVPTMNQLFNDVYSSTDLQNWNVISPNTSANTKWSGRAYSEAVYFAGQYWVIGGGGTTSFSSKYGEVWASPDGITWTQKTSSAPFAAYFGYKAVSFNNKLWVIGGDKIDGLTGPALPAVWNSSDGINWTTVTTTAPWGQRSGHAVLVYNGKMYLMAGQDNSQPPAVGFPMDVWESSDGITWTRITNSVSWGPLVSPLSVVFNNKMWLMGGDNINGFAYNAVSKVWNSSDGITWTLVSNNLPFTQNSLAGAVNAVVANGKIVFGDAKFSAGAPNYLYTTTDGINWTTLTGPAGQMPWSQRFGYRLVVKPALQVLTAAQVPLIPVNSSPLNMLPKTIATCPASGYKYVSQWGTFGTGNGQFLNPVGVAIASSGSIYTLDTGIIRIQKFSQSGAYLTQFGTQGSGNGQLGWPWNVAFDASGNVYVADQNNHRIQKFDANGNYLSQWGTQGTGNGQFKNPVGIAIDSIGNIYVADQNNSRIQKFTSTGAYITQWGVQGNGNGQFKQPFSLAVDSSNNIYVVDFQAARIQKFTSTGAYITQWGAFGSGNGQFSDPSDIAIDASGNVYITDTHNYRIQKFTSSGTFITQWGTQGSGNGQFKSPAGIAVDSLGAVYIADQGNYRIQKFAPCQQLQLVAVELKPDLIVDDFSWIPATPHVHVITNPASEPIPNTNLVFSVRIKNIGNVAALLPQGTQVNITKGGTVYGAEQLLSPVIIAVGQTHTVTVYQSTTPNILATAGNSILTAAVDNYGMGTGNSWHLVDESNEANNLMSKNFTVLP